MDELNQVPKHIFSTVLKTALRDSGLTLKNQGKTKGFRRVVFVDKFTKNQYIS